jgi:hypothetical protein
MFVYKNCCVDGFILSFIKLYTQQDANNKNNKERLYSLEFEDACEQGVEEIFGPKSEEVTGGWREMHNEELNKFRSSPVIIGMLKLRRMRWAGHASHMGEWSSAYKFW